MPLLPVDDPTPFVSAARAGLAVVPGCWVMTGEVHGRMDVGIFGKDDARWRLTGQLVDGAWRGFGTTELEDANPEMQSSFDSGAGELPFLPPLLGRLPQTEDIDTEAGLLPALLGVLQRDTETAFVVVDGDRYRLERTLDSRRKLFGGTRENLVQVWFDAEGRPLEWHVVTEVPVHVSGFTLRDVDATLKVDAAGVPVSERLEAVGAWGPLRMTIDRAITYGPPVACAS